MGCQQGAGAPPALQDIEHAWRKPGLQIDLSQFHSGHGRELGRLENHGIASRKRGGRLPAGNLQRVVPGTNANADAQRFTPGVGKGILQRVLCASQSSRRTGEVLQAIGTALHVDDQRLL